MSFCSGEIVGSRELFEISLISELKELKQIIGISGIVELL
jgi:hypothetical protein